jgi:lysophospholipase L1-like esterase
MALESPQRHRNLPPLPAGIKQLAAAAAYGSAGVTAVGMLATGVLIGQALIARRIIPTAEQPPPRSDGRYGFGHPGTPVKLALLGDSSAAGYGVDAPRKTLGALLATGLAEQLHRPVDLRCVAVVGAQSRHLAPQAEKLLDDPPDLAVVLIGGNDVTHRSNVPDAVRALADAVRALRMMDTDVVVGTCPDMGAVQPIQPPLKWLVHRWSRQLAALQTVAVVEAGGRTVSLGDLLGPTFAADPEHMFAWDRFHPSAEGYEAAAAVLLPSMVSALAEPAGPCAAVPDGAGVRDLYAAAAKAVEQTGTEVAPATVAGRERGPNGRWAHLRRRAWQFVGRPMDPAHVP